MATGVLGLGSSGSNGLSQEVLDKLKAAEAKAKVDPYTTKLETWDKELEKITEIESKVTALLSSITSFDLYSATTNAFDQVSASTTGTAAVFNALNTNGIKEGNTTVTISQLAQKDVYQTTKFTDKESLISGAQDSGDKLSIIINGITYDYSTEGKTYQQLVDSINTSDKLIASVEKVSDTESRLVIKSKESGMANALSITQTGIDLGLADSANHILSAKNLQAKVDGIDYDVSSNSITLQGNLTMTAVELGTSTISLQQDKSYISEGLNTFITAYNELLDIIDEEQFSEDSPIEDIGSLKSILSSVKTMLFGSYGTNDDLSMFNYGLSVDAMGYLSVDATQLSDALTDNFDDLKSLFVGTAEKPGMGTQLKEYLDGLDSYDGTLTVYGETMASRKTKLEEEKTKAQELLDTKYSLMAQQFAAYTAIITQMEAAFGGMKMMIQQSTSGN